MALPKLRNLGAVGVIADRDPYDLPPNAFSMAVNVRFRNGRVTSAPVHKSVKLLSTDNPRYVAGFTPTQGISSLFIGYRNGRVFSVANGVETDYSVAGYVQNDVEATWTSCFLADTIYINRSDRAPWMLGLANAQFLPLPNMDSAWTAQLLRVCTGALVALNVTKGGTTYQTMVKTSSQPLAGEPPASWDITQANTLASENILAEMHGPIMDACNLGRDLIIYGLNEAWRMTATADIFEYSYTKLPFSKGSLNANCSIEINSKNYVFGSDDIWVHDGVSEDSVCDQRVRDFIYGSINMSQASRCFVSHNQQLHEIHFNFVSGDQFVKFSPASGINGCNRRAVLDYVNNTWTFDDAPSVFGASRASLDVSQTWSSGSQTWASVNGPWQALDDTAKRCIVYVGETNTTYSLSKSLYAFDPYSTQLPGMPPAITAFSVDPNATGFAFLERDGIDLEALDADLQGYKLISYVVPLGRIDPQSSQSLNFSLGAADYYNETPTFTTPQGFDSQSLYKIDLNQAGRYVCLKVNFNDYPPFSWSGFDFDVDVTGER